MLRTRQSQPAPIRREAEALRRPETIARAVTTARTGRFLRMTEGTLPGENCSALPLWMMALAPRGSAPILSGGRGGRGLDGPGSLRPARGVDPSPAPSSLRWRSPNVDQTTTPAADLQQKYRQFLDLLPLTVALAGLPPSEGRLFSEEQIEARAITMRAAYRVARATAKECLGGS